MVHPGARRSAGAVDRDMDLVDRVELGRAHAGQEPRETGRGAPPHHQRPLDLEGEALQGEEGLDVSAVITGGDDRPAGLEEDPGLRVLGRRRGQHHHIGLGPDSPFVCGADLRLIRTPRWSRRDEEDLVDVDPIDEVGDHPAADDAVADDADPHQGRSSNGTSCQPPRWGGTPPRPRTRSTPAISPATPTASNARRITLTTACSNTSAKVPAARRGRLVVPPAPSR